MTYQFILLRPWKPMGPTKFEESLQLLREGLLHPPPRILPWVWHFWPTLPLFFPPTPAITRGGGCSPGPGQGRPCAALLLWKSRGQYMLGTTKQLLWFSSWNRKFRKSVKIVYGFLPKCHFVLHMILRCCFDMLWAVAVRCNVQRGSGTAGELIPLELPRQIWSCCFSLDFAKSETQIGAFWVLKVHLGTWRYNILCYRSLGFGDASLPDQPSKIIINDCWLSQKHCKIIGRDYLEK